jgi:maltose alpha-D-glucosyltransferase/alpha-amylase
VVIGERLLLKGSRRLRGEIDVEIEMGRFLTEHAPAVKVVPIAGSVELRHADGTVSALALLLGYVENQGDAWDYTQGYLERFLTDSLAAPPVDGAGQEDLHASYRLLMTILGRRTAELHVALVEAHGDPAFEPEPIAAGEPALWAEAVVEELTSTLHLLQQRLENLSGAALAAAGAVLAQADDLATRASSLGRPVNALKSRLHGNLHLGQILIVGSDLMLTGFGSTPDHGVAQGRAKHSALRDVATVLRSIDAAAAAALGRLTAERGADQAPLQRLARGWRTVAREAFLAGYREQIAGCGSWPSDAAEAERLIALFGLERALGDVRDGLVRRPERVAISLEALLDLLAESGAAGTVSLSAAGGHA